MPTARFLVPRHDGVSGPSGPQPSIAPLLCPIWLVADAHLPKQRLRTTDASSATEEELVVLGAQSLTLQRSCHPSRIDELFSKDTQVAIVGWVPTQETADHRNDLLQIEH